MSQVRRGAGIEDATVRPFRHTRLLQELYIASDRRFGNFEPARQVGERRKPSCRTRSNSCSRRASAAILPTLQKVIDFIQNISQNTCLW